MTSTNASHAASVATYRAALAAVLDGMKPDDARSIRSYAVRFLEHCLKVGVDPLVPGATAFEQFSAELSERQRWRFAHAARRVLAEVGQPARRHGLGLGDQSHLVREALKGPARGLVSLLTLASYIVLGDGSPMSAFGIGGIERWIVYPVILWVIAFGGYLSGRADGDRTAGPP